MPAMVVAANGYRGHGPLLRQKEMNSVLAG